MNEVSELIIFGRKIGTFTGFDHSDTFAVCFYDFAAGEGCDIPSCACLDINYDTGRASATDDEGEKTLFDLDLIEAVKNCPVKAPAPAA